ncbi:hypothetical protein HBI16_005170 [Parastagonospora nodorum]|nr:hypothetical protein HBI16_005170 [Parastagonospora nodorum]
MDIASVQRIVGRIVGCENCVFPSLHVMDGVGRVARTRAEAEAAGCRERPAAKKMPRSGAGRTSKPRCATVRSFSHAECRSLTHGVAGVAAFPSKACWRGVEVKCCDELGRHPCCSLGMLRLNFEAPAWPLADALRGLADGKWPRWASAHICRYSCALSRWDKTIARSRMLAGERGTVVQCCCAPTVSSGGSASSAVDAGILVDLSNIDGLWESRCIIACARPQHLAKAAGARLPPRAPTPQPLIPY